MFSLQLLLMMLYSCLIINAAPSTVSLDSSIVIESSPTIISQTIGTLESASEILEPSLSSMYLHPTPSSTPAVPIPESTKVRITSQNVSIISPHFISGCETV